MSSNSIKQSAAGIFVSLGFQFFTSAIPGEGQAEAQEPARQNEQAAHSKTKPIAETSAIFVFNRAGNKGDPLRQPLEDMATTQITGLGWKVISRELTTKALREYPDPLKAEGQDSFPGASLDAILSNNTSALRLAQNLGARYLLSVAVTSLTQRNRTITAYGNKIAQTIQTLRISYRLAEGEQGRTLISDTVATSHTQRQTEFEVTIADSETPLQLLAEACAKMRESIQSKLAIQADSFAQQNAASVDAQPTFEIVAIVNDINIPDVIVDQSGNATTGTKSYPVSASGVTVELDGVVIGTTPGTFKTNAGIHKMRLSRQGLKDWERTVNIFDGQKLSVAMELDTQGHQRWKETTAFLNGLKRESILSQSEYKTLQGYTHMLKQSGLKVNTAEGLQIINKKQSLFD